MKFFILLLGVGLVLAQDETTTESMVTDAVTDVVTDAVTTESSERQVCDGRGKLMGRTRCAEICRRPFKFGESPIFNVVLVGQPCRTSRRSRENDGQCQLSTRFGRNFGVCRPVQEQE